MRRFLTSIAVVWLLSWLPIGLWVGDPDFVLTTVSRGTWERQLYQWLFYGGILLVFIDSWRRHRPRQPGWGQWKHFPLFFAQGLLASIALRAVLAQLEMAHWTSPVWSADVLVTVTVSSLAVALIEESIFRGFLLGHLVSRLGFRNGAAATSLLFAGVHLFRPGDWHFKVCYGIGLFALAQLLANIAWKKKSILASAGFHAGVIFLNLWLSLSVFHPGLWAGWNSEPVSGMVSLILTIGYLGGWHWFYSRAGKK